MDFSFTTASMTALLTLTLMEIVLGIDNIIFIAILVGKINDVKARAKIRNLGISLALIMRIGLLFSLSYLMGLTKPLFTMASLSLSGRDLILIIGGLFLLAKSTLEIHHKLEDPAGSDKIELKKAASGFASMIIQIIILDIVFSLDSVITAVGMTDNLSIMIMAMVISMIVMLLAANGISNFVQTHPTIKILALSFLLMIGIMLVAEGLGTHINKGYIYFAMFFSLAVEMINIKLRSKLK